MSQQTLFDAPETPKRPVWEIRTISPVAQEKARLSRQCTAILERLREGTATNAELAGISLKYSGRISDLRKAGYVVRVVERNYKTGLTVYELG